jgi:ABC-type tungstate transport system permease subunit
VPAPLPGRHFGRGFFCPGFVVVRASGNRNGDSVVAVGKGQASAIGRRGNADALLFHDRIGEDTFVAQGQGIDCSDVSCNDFVTIRLAR